MASTSIDVPAPLGTAALDAVPGVLGSIARERAEAYRSADVPQGGDAPLRPGESGAFVNALAGTGLAFITEIKRGSPSQGAIADLDPVEAARAYGTGGAAALSVLTEPKHFGGALEHLRAVTQSQPLPAMRKEFIVHPQQVLEASGVGAQAVLLIAAVLGDDLAAYLAYAHALGLDALVEVHDERELDRALESGSTLIGVNNRDLTTLHVDLAVAPRVMEAARLAGYAGLLVAESGYRTGEDLAAVLGLADAVLVGTSLAGSGDLTGSLQRLRREVHDLERERAS